MADLTEACLYGSTMCRMNLDGAVMQRTNLSGADLSKSIITQTDITNSNICSANLSDTDCSGANFSGSWLVGAYFSRSILNNTNFTRAYMLRAALNKADLYDSIFYCADLTKADLSGIRNYNKTNEILLEVIKRQGLNFLTEKEQSITFEITIFNLSWKEIKGNYGDTVVPVFRKLADAGYNEWLIYYESIT